MTATQVMWILLGGLAWAALAVACRLAMNNPRGDLESGIIFYLVRAYARVVHRLRAEGTENLPRCRRGLRYGTKPGESGPLIVVANHTSGVDPILIQAVLHLDVRWMMGQDMLHPALSDFWSWARVIPVSRVWVEGEEPARESIRGGEASRRADSQAAVEAIRHLRAGGVLGVFPEGRISPREGDLLPFLPGVGVIARKTGASILPAVIRGTPRGGSAWSALFRPSHAVVRFLPVVEYAKTSLDAPAIVADLRARMEAALREALPPADHPAPDRRDA
jgi:1-acyl-sn-glycerol-3-phosphate acyltransferase